MWSENRSPEQALRWLAGFETAIASLKTGGAHTGKWPDEDEALREGEQIVCHEKLGGILRHYERVAA